MEEILAALLWAFGEVCCQALVAVGADVLAGIAAYMSGNENSRHQKGWRIFFWTMLPVGIILTILVVIVYLFRSR